MASEDRPEGIHKISWCIYKLKTSSTAPPTIKCGNTTGSNRKMAQPLIPCVLVFFLLLSSLVMKPSPFRWLIWPGIASLVFVQLYDNSTNDPRIDALLLLYTFVASDYIILTDVQRELRRAGQPEPIPTASFLTRLHWALRLLCSPRGVGWSHEPKGVLPPRPRLSRGRFIISQLFWLAFYVLLADAGGAVIGYTSILAKSSIPTASQPWHWRIFGVILFTVVTVSAVGVSHITLSIVGVGTGISEPEGWPHIYGKWTDMYTVRNFWGRTWHQLLRRILNSHGKHLARCLHLPAGSKRSALVQLFTAFIISGIIHSHPTDTRPMYFFVAQPLAIIFEEAVIKAANRAGYTLPTMIHKVVGYMWVACWFTLSIPGFMDAMINSGVADSLIDIGVTSGLLHHIGLVNG